MGTRSDAQHAVPALARSQESGRPDLRVVALDLIARHAHSHVAGDPVALIANDHLKAGPGTLVQAGMLHVNGDEREPQTPRLSPAGLHRLLVCIGQREAVRGLRPGRGLGPLTASPPGQVRGTPLPRLGGPVDVARLFPQQGSLVPPGSPFVRLSRHRITACEHLAITSGEQHIRTLIIPLCQDRRHLDRHIQRPTPQKATGLGIDAVQVLIIPHQAEGSVHQNR